jgi:excinuclease ABC subunit C
MTCILKKQKIKEKIEVLENYQSRPTIVNPKSRILTFSIVSDESALCEFLANFTRLDYSISYHGNQEEAGGDAELLELAIELRSVFNYYLEKLPFPVDLGENLKVTVPQLGIKTNSGSFCSKCEVLH